MRSWKLLSAILTLAAAPSFANDDTPQLHPLDKACVTYEMTGQMMSGGTTRCHRDYGYEQYEIQETTVGFAGVTQTQRQHVIIIGETIYSINLDTNSGTKTQNPMYASVTAALQNSSPDQMSQQFFDAMGLTPNGETKTIAGASCAVYTSAMMGTVCMTDNGLMLEQDFMGSGQIATSVNVGDGGDDENYTLYQTVPITDGPDLSNGLQGLFQQQ